MDEGRATRDAGQIVNRLSSLVSAEASSVAPWQLCKTKPNAGFWPEILSTKPGTLNKEAFPQGMILQNKANLCSYHRER